jgi:chromosome segregation ATPase
MRIRHLTLGAAFVAAVCYGEARADTETDRLREALRSATTQMRQLEDQRTALQAKVAGADREIAVAKAQVDAAKGEVRQVEKQHREAVDEFNQRLEERNQTLEKWKTAYEEAATVARAKDAERAKFEGEANAFKASTKSCQAKNTQLIVAGREILKRYHSLTLGDAFVASEPLTGLGRVGVQNFLQDSTDKVLDQKVTP